MKKIIFLASFVLVVGSIYASNKKSIVKTEADSTSYAYGVGLAQQGLQQFLTQTGVLGDTAAVRVAYDANIASELDGVKKAKLEKELSFKIDSIAKANKKNMELFVNGLTIRFKEKDEKASFYEGVAIASQLVKMIPSFSTQLYGQDSKEKIDKSLVLAGLLDVLNNKTIQMENASGYIESKMALAQAEAQKQKDAEAKSQNASEIELGEKFMNDNKAKEGVVTLPSGLQYKVITEGTGAKPTAEDRVKVHYKGTLIDGTVFDSSIDRGEPAVFGVGQVIKGWTEALQLMPVGSKWMLYIPHELAYGARGAGDVIKPFSNLIFEVELLEIVK